MFNNRLTSIGPRQRDHDAVGIYSVCSSHLFVLKAAFARALKDNSQVLLEATCNQVNQFKGYSGMTPADFTAYVRSVAEKIKFPKDRLIIGGDHLGPHVWRSQPAESAMANAEILVEQCVLAGYGKIHLDASMALGDDPKDPLDMEISAKRAARLCLASEAAAKKRSSKTLFPLYVVGAEVPTPGGSLASVRDVPVTDPADLSQYLDCCENEFKKLGLEDAWTRVIAVVVQPGIDFGQLWVAPYRSKPASDLSAFHDSLPHAMTYEIHATDYQKPRALIQMVKDHFALLKVGPCLTYAMREGLFALACVEKELLGRKKSAKLSGLRDVLFRVLYENPEYWRSHHPDSGREPDWLVFFSYLDRVRYYWNQNEVNKAVDKMITNLGHDIALPLIGQYLPEQYRAVEAGSLAPAPMAIVEHKIASVLRVYADACRMSQNTGQMPGRQTSAKQKLL
jgi:D-tagatose-1,6-bisphosphate aldolase subunit GatZ/KbaZ